MHHFIAISWTWENEKHKEFDLARAFSVAQHHDGITGTDTQAVNEDFIRRLHSGRNDFLSVAENTFKQHEIMDPFWHCDQLNISVCHFTENEKGFTVTTYFPGSWEYRGTIRLPVNKTGSYRVRDGNNAPVPSDIYEVSDTTKSIRGKRGYATHELLLRPIITPGALTAIQIDYIDTTQSVSRSSKTTNKYSFEVNQNTVTIRSKKGNHENLRTV